MARTANNPIWKMIASLEGGPYYTISQVSQITDTPVETLRTWIKRGNTQAPSKQIMVGTVRVHLYTEDDLTEIRARRNAPVEDRKK